MQELFVTWDLYNASDTTDFASVFFSQKPLIRREKRGWGTVRVVMSLDMPQHTKR